MHKMFIFVNSKIILRTAVRLTPSFIFPIIGNHNEHDHDIINMGEPETPKTGFDRVKTMFKKNEFDEISAELNNVVQMTLCGCFFGACMGGFARSKDAYVNFIENNQATIFKSTMEAKKRLQDHVTVAFAKGAYHWGWRLGMFSGLFGLFTTTLSVYRGDNSLVDYVSAGAITGALYKANLGPAAMVVGAGLGAALSLIGGLLIFGVLKVTGRSMDDIRASMYKLKIARKEQYDQAVEKSAVEKHDNLTRHHDVLVQEKGVTQVDNLG
ncbi:complex I assembly factor TIMMDC1, mitochondrial [Epargyreus clarus]|uniref:complex I assembly factor TIMMDC1, mitochondrial n=1 Tax=Epargyreus clarus TaxID=520877 RepID=UPI003C2EC49C